MQMELNMPRMLAYPEHSLNVQQLLHVSTAISETSMWGIYPVGLSLTGLWSEKDSLYLKQGTQVEHWNGICLTALGHLCF